MTHDQVGIVVTVAGVFCQLFRGDEEFRNTRNGVRFEETELETLSDEEGEVHSLAEVADEMSFRFRFGLRQAGYAIIVAISQDTDNRQVVENGDPNERCSNTCPSAIGIPNDIIRGKAHHSAPLHITYLVFDLWVFEGGGDGGRRAARPAFSFVAEKRHAGSHLS